MPRAAATMPRAPAARRSRAGASPAGTGCRHAHAPLESLLPTLGVERVGLLFQDLRCTAMTRRGEASATETGMAAVSGRSIDRSRQILETYVVCTTNMADTAIETWAQRERDMPSGLARGR